MVKLIDQFSNQYEISFGIKILGRSIEDCNIPMPPKNRNIPEEQSDTYQTVSSVHAILRYDEETRVITIEDNNSTNGTYINNQKLEPEETYRLNKEDKINLGNLELSLIL